MLRIATLVAFGALIAAPASAQSIRITTAGKSSQQIQAEVHKAAVRVCSDSTEHSGLDFYLRRSCIRGAEHDALAQAGAFGSTEKVASR